MRGLLQPFKIGTGVLAGGLVCAVGVLAQDQGQGESASGSNRSPPVEIESLGPGSAFDYHLDDQVAVATNGVVVRYGDAFLRARSVRLNQKTGMIHAQGDVYLQKGEHVFTGERFRYNYKKETIEAGQFRMGRPPLFVQGDSLTTQMGSGTNRVYRANDAFVTTDNVDDPGYRIRTTQLKLAPNRFIEARNATVQLGDVPVLYFPYYRRSLQQDGNRFEIIPGYRGEYGGYLLGTYYWSPYQNVDTALNLDYRQKRGIGVGPNIDYDLGQYGDGEFKYYYLQDQDPDENPFTDEPIQEDRYRLHFSHQATLRTNLNATLMVRKQSDPLVTRDFLESEFRDNTQPDSYLELNQLWRNFSLNVLTRPRLNDFFGRVERLPDVKLSSFRQQIGASPLYYEGESSAGYFRRKFAFDRQPEFASFRADTFHQLVLPKTFFGWLNVSPRVGGRFTQYGEANGPGGTTDDEARAVFNTGTEVSFKAHRVWPGVENDFWNVHELRHIVEPSVNYSYIPTPNVRPFEVPQFDRKLTTFELPSLYFPDFNAIDSIDGRNVFRYGLENRLQTKRQEGVVNFVDWGLYTDWRLNPRRRQDTFRDIFSDLAFRPSSWLTLHSKLRYDIENTRLRLAQHGATIQPNTKWSWSLAHRFVRTGPVFGLGNNLIMSRFYYRFNENWGARISHRFEARDGRLEEQEYTLYRDMRSWTAALSFRVREGRNEPTDYSIAATLSLKAFPSFDLGEDRNEPQRLSGR